MAEVFKGRNQDRTEFKVVGKWGIPGRESYSMAAGTAKYSRDLVIPDMLFGKGLRSPYAHARIKSIDTSRAEALPGMRAVIRWDDPEIKAMPLMKGLGVATVGDNPVLSDTANHEGDEVGVILAADSEEICDEALKLIKVEWQELPFILDPREAIKPDAPILQPELNPNTNVFSEKNWEDGNVTAGFAQADKIIEYDFGWPRWYHHRPIPLTVVAYWEQDPMGTEGKTLVVDTPRWSAQGGGAAPHYVAMKAFRVIEDKVHVLTPYGGGKYCGASTDPRSALSPLLAKRAGKPVRMAETRREDFEGGGCQSYAHVKIGFKNDGMLTAAYGQIVEDGGSPGSQGTLTGNSMIDFRSTWCPNIKNETKVVFTTSGYGKNEDAVHFGYEILGKAFYVIANELGMDPTEVALKNCHTPEPSLKECIEKGKVAMGWQWHAPGTKTLPNGRMHGLGFRYKDVGAPGRKLLNVALALKDDGKVYMPYQEEILGTFWQRAMAMVIAEELGAKIEDVIVHFVPNLPWWFQGASRDRGPNNSWAAKEAAIDLKAKLLQTAAATLKVAPEELDTKDSTVYLKADPTKSYPFSQFASPYELSAAYTGRCPKYDASLKPGTLTTMSAIFCEVEVDPETGEVEITKFVAAVDSGKIISPSSWEGQIEGQCTRATIGAGMREELIWDKATGVKLNASTLEYKPPTILDNPTIQPIAVETRTGTGCYGASGNSHHVGDKAVITLAVQNAIGKWIDDIPITPDKVLKALGKI